MQKLLVSFIQKLNFLITYIFQKNFSEIEFLKMILKDEAVIVDIGSNLGNFISTLKKINKKTTIYSIEPNIDLINFQKKKFKKEKNIKFFNIGIDSNNRIAKFYIRKPVSHSSLLDSHPDEEFNEVVSTSEVEVETLDSFIEKHNVNKITLLKIDTEGLDYEILTSLKILLLNKKIEYIKIEANHESFEKIVSFCNTNNIKFVGISSMFYHRNKLNMMDIYLENKNFSK
tara:strand:+ start:393 stop:1079 length:687 start_codon:yes stop_codon:yes gene_type:complete